VDLGAYSIWLSLTPAPRICLEYLAKGKKAYHNRQTWDQLQQKGLVNSRRAITELGLAVAKEGRVWASKN
jgi:hypothetical protein